MLAVGFDEEDVFVFANGGLDEEIAKFGLERGVQVEFGLLDGDRLFLSGDGVHDHGKQLADACSHVAVRNLDSRFAVEKLELG